MTKKKLPEFKMGDLVRKGDTYEIVNITKEPTATILNLTFQEYDDQEETVPFSELATYEHYPHSTRIGRPPRKAKPVVVEAKILTECEGSITTTPPTDKFLKGIMERQHQDWNESQAQNGALPLADDTCPPEEIPPPAEEHPSKVDLSTFTLSVKGEGRWQHEMTLGVGVDTQFAKGKDLKPTLLRLLGKVGITGSDAEVETALVLFPDSEGRNRILDILKGNKGG